MDHIPEGRFSQRSTQQVGLGHGPHTRRKIFSKIYSTGGFRSWTTYQKEDFLKDLLNKLVPNYLDSLFSSMGALKVKDKPPSIFECQLKLFDQWFSQWTDADRSNFIIQLQCIDPDFVAHFNSLYITHTGS
ncbi:uncharacterized protein C14orf119-like isoform X3 [Physella acuta]|uniref:uncharacterized protein C14orf119-like isoform X3 n=1 Tax=Physella acuta TaxID=109671 RepID=UPI0027DBC918|nr:uncharacterized protein C14orf119-like isoform X3 [Physella acuta]